ncbi:MAG: efflux RND transporter permease subunit [Planctomycetes bacterium]|nr:efflux RND transporter permease subunit [Planctomycetota bacterium]
MTRALLAHRLLVIMAAGGVAAGGFVAWTLLPIDAFPDVTNVQVMILTPAPGLAAVDVEERVSFPIELAMRGLPKVRQVRSLSRAELSQVVIVFEDGADTYWTRQVVFERLEVARANLPPGLEPELGPISTGLGEIFQYTLESDRHDLMELRSLQDWLVAPRLKPLAGVNEVNSFGGAVKQYQVLLDPAKLLKYGVAPREVVEAVERGNANAAGGVIVEGWEQVYLRGVGLLRDIPDIERIVLKDAGGTPVYVRDVADVVIGAAPRQGAVTRDGRGETVAGMVIMLKGANSREVVDRVKEAVRRIGGALPEGARIDVFYDRTSLIEACIATVRNALLEGAVFVILVLFLFVAELRTALVVLCSLPLTFLASFIVMGWTGLSSNLMSLGGLAFSVGMVVDASIVIVENSRRVLSSSAGDDADALVAAATGEVGRPTAFSVLIIAIILVPLFTLQDIEGKMFAPLAATMLIALLVSLAVALTAMPALGRMLLPRRAVREFPFVRRIRSGYLALLDGACARPGLVMAVSAVVLAAACAVAPMIGTEFMPSLDEGAIAINAVRLPNAALDGAVRVSDFIESRLRKFPEVETVVSKTGRAEVSEDPMGPEQTDILIMLKPRRSWTGGRDKAALVAAIRTELEAVPGLRLSFSQPIALRVNELVSGVKSDLAVKVFGEDFATLAEQAQAIAGAMAGVAGARDVKVEQIAGMTQLDAVIDREAAARHGIRIADINAAIEIGAAGVEATTLIEGQRRVAVAVRFAPEARSDAAAIERILVVAPNGRRVPLGQLARLERVEQPGQISRENGVRRVVVECNVGGRDLGSFVRDVERAVAPITAALPPGYFLEYGGQFENQMRAMGQLAIVVPVALLLIFVLLFLALGSVRHSLLVLLNLPFALVGGVFAAAAFGLPLSVSAAVACIVLLGIAVQNGVVLAAYFRQLRQAGAPLAEAVRTGCDVRFRPLVMTALTSFIGHLPMIYSTGAGVEIQKPLAVVVMGGLVTSTLLTLIVLPAVYLFVEKRLGGKVAA